MIIEVDDFLYLVVLSPKVVYVECRVIDHFPVLWMQAAVGVYQLTEPFMHGMHVI